MAMRILTLNYEYPPLGGGGGPVCRELCELFARRGHEVEVVTMGFRGLPRRETLHGVRVRRVPALRRRQATCETHEMLSYVVSALPGIVWRLRRRPPDIIHAHFVVPTGLLAWLGTFARPAIPYVVTAHGSDIPGFNPDRFTKEHRFLPPLLRRIARRAALVTSPSDFLVGLMEKNLGLSDVERIPNGIESGRFRVDPAMKRRRVLMTGRLLPRKGFQYVIEALGQLGRSDFDVHVAGDGPMREELEALARGITPEVVFHGWLDHDSPLLRELYETSSIFCLPSECENASISLLEAMSAGMVVVTSDVTGCPETVGEAGVSVGVRNVEALVEALGALLADEALCAQKGALARRRVEERFDWEKIADVYLRRFEDIVAGAAD